MVIHNLDDAVEVLYDKKDGSSKEVSWQLHRLVTLRLATSYKRLQSHKYKRIVDCGGYLEFRRLPDNSLRLQYMNSCHLRLCPTCGWRRTKRIYHQVRTIYDSITNDYDFIFLTLTIRNCKGESLPAEIDNMVSAFKRLNLRKQFRDAVRGWVKVFEITYNWSTGEYHPHYHCILAVDSNYFTSQTYITQEAFCSLWGSCLRVDYKPVVDVRAFTASEKGQGKEIAELAKYAVKSSNIMTNLSCISLYNKDIQDAVMELTDSLTDKIVLTLDNALASRRLIEYGGIFKEKHRDLRLDDDIDDDLIHTGAEKIQGGSDYQIERYGWSPGHRQYLRIDG